MSCCSSASICSRPRSRSVSVGAADDVAQRRLRRPAHRLRVVLHFERRLLRVVHHPEQHGVDVDRHGVGGQRLLGGEAGGDGALIDPRRHRVDERHDPEQSRAAQTDEPARGAALIAALPTAARRAATASAPTPIDRRSTMMRDRVAGARSVSSAADARASRAESESRRRWRAAGRRCTECCDAR